MRDAPTIVTAPSALAGTAAAPRPGDLAADGWVDVGGAADVPLLEGREATVDGRRIAVFRLPSGYAATDAACPHRGGPLADGLVADGCVTCPLHNWRLDLTTGEISGDDAPMALHEVAVVDDRIWVRIAPDAGPAPAPAPRVTAGEAAKLWGPKGTARA